MKKRVYTLYRVSTKGQVEKDDIPMQKEACRNFAESQGWEIVKEFSEKGVSGFKKSAKERDELQKIQQAAMEGKFDILLVFMFDRLGRRDDETPFIVEWFTKQGIEVWSVNEGQQRFDTHVAEAREALETLEKQLVQAQEEYEEATKTAKRSNYICNELFTWADVYDTANHDERRAILQQFIKEIRVRKDYEISITLNASFNQVEQLKAVSTYDGAGIFEEISEKGA